MLQVGIAKADITPRAGIEMGGFGKRIQPCLGVNDPIYATALVADDGKTTIAVVDCDLVMVWADFVADVRRRVEKLAGIPGANVLVSATHSHYGPMLPRPVAGGGEGGGRPRIEARPTRETSGGKSGGGGEISVEQAYRDFLVCQIAGLVYEAKSGGQPARIRVGVGSCDIGINRRERNAAGEIVLGENPEGPIDRSVGVCRIETADGKPLAAVVNFATHPVGQDVQIRKVSADYVGATRRVVEELTGATCLFWQGATGDINIRGAETDYAHVAALGSKLGREAARVWASAQSISGESGGAGKSGGGVSGGVGALWRTVELPPYRGLSAEHAEQERQRAERQLAAARLNPKTTPGLLAWMEKEVKQMEMRRDSWTNPALVPPAVKAQLQAFCIGDLAWACVPGELFNELGMQIKQGSPFPHTFVVAYANNWIGYLPTPKAFQEGGYEVSQVCYLSPEGIRMMMEQLAAMLRELRG